MGLKDKLIRKFLDHGIGSTIIKIGIDGRIRAWGSTDPMNRSHDFWRFEGYRYEYNTVWLQKQLRGE